MSIEAIEQPEQAAEAMRTTTNRGAATPPTLAKLTTSAKHQYLSRRIS